jgi:plastocyanin
MRKVPDAGEAGKAVDAGDAGNAKVVQIGVGPTGEHTFIPPSLTVPVGTTVQWFWYSSGHNVISGAGGVPDNKFCSPNNNACATAPTSTFGSTFEHTFTAPGTYPYFCAPHYSVGMKGTITVQ